MKVDVHAHRGGFAMSAAFEARPGEILAVIGPNGSGKSTLLNAIAGHLPATGVVTIGDRVLDAPAGPGAAGPIHVPPERRRIALLGQRPLLFPHLSVRENVAFGPRSQGVPRAEARRRAELRLAQVGLSDLAGRRPAALSGGQQQRAALARALAAEPDALLLDEPFAALDAPSAAQARRLLAAPQAEGAAIPVVLVTHDPMDALILAARTLVMHDGSVVQSGDTAEVLGHPRTAFVAALAGVNRLDAIGAGGGGVRTTAGLVLHGHGDPLRMDEPGSVVFAPASVRVEAGEQSALEPAAGTNRWTGHVAELDPIAGGIRLRTVEHPAIAIDCPSTHAVALGLRPGQRLAFALDAADVSIRSDVPSRGR